VAELHQQMRESSELIKALADQNTTQLISALRSTAVGLGVGRLILILGLIAAKIVLLQTGWTQYRTTSKLPRKQIIAENLTPLLLLILGTVAVFNFC
jgi:hypothetical protein